MLDRTQINSHELDNYITGHYGEDQFLNEYPCCICEEEAEFSLMDEDFCPTHAMKESENFHFINRLYRGMQ